MKAKLFAACALGVLALAGAAEAGEVRIRDAVARVVVIPEADRTRIDVEIVRGAADLPLRVTRHGDDVRIEGDARRVRQCRRGSLSHPVNPTAIPEDVTVTVGSRTVRVAESPLVTIRTPMDVDISAGGAVWGAIGRAREVELGVGGCGDWSVANVEGDLSISVGGSGNVRAGTAHDLDVQIGGSGDVRTGAVRSAEIAIGGSGDVDIASVDGPVEVSIGGSGDVVIRGGRASELEVAIAGSGAVTLNGEARDVSASIIGSGDVNVAQVTGRLDRTVVGSGRVNVGPVSLPD